MPWSALQGPVGAGHWPPLQQSHPLTSAHLHVLFLVPQTLPFSPEDWLTP